MFGEKQIFVRERQRIPFSFGFNFVRNYRDEFFVFGVLRFFCYGLLVKFVAVPFFLFVFLT